MSSFKFRSVGGSRSYRSWKSWEEGDTLTCKFIKQYEDQYQNAGYEVEVIECDFHNEEDIVDEGKIMGLNGCGSLNYKMEEIPQGAIIQVVYEGKGKVEKGPMKGKDFHDVSVLVDENSVSGMEAPNAKAMKQEEPEDDYDL